MYSNVNLKNISFLDFNRVVRLCRVVSRNFIQANVDWKSRQPTFFLDLGLNCFAYLKKSRANMVFSSRRFSDLGCYLACLKIALQTHSHSLLASSYIEIMSSSSTNS